MSVFVTRQLMESSHEGQSASERIFEHIRTNADWNIRPDGDDPHETLKVAFGLSVVCAELDEFNRQLKTYGWQRMVRKANDE